jgi:hypothetical protein
MSHLDIEETKIVDVNKNPTAQGMFWQATGQTLSSRTGIPLIFMVIWPISVTLIILFWVAAVHNWTTLTTWTWYVFVALIALAFLRLTMYTLLRARSKHIDLQVKQQTINLQDHAMYMREQLLQYAMTTSADIEMLGVKITHPTVTVTENDYIDSNEPLLLPSPVLPEKCSLLDVMRKWDLRLDNLFLALGKGGKELACSLEGFMHVAHDSPTGGGKTSQWKAEEAQLLKLGIQVIHINPHFAPIDKKGGDWRPIARAIEEQGLIEVAPQVYLPGIIFDFDLIAKLLKWLAMKEIDRRFDLQRRGNYTYKPVYLFIDEWRGIVKRHPECAEYLADILARGRAVEVFVDSNSQGFLVNDVDLPGSARENFNTAYHMGGSVHSGAKLLDIAVKDLNALLKQEEVTLGKGIALLRNNESVPLVELVRLPFADNDSIYYLFGRADDWVLPIYRPEYQRQVQEELEEEQSDVRLTPEELAYTPPELDIPERHDVHSSSESGKKQERPANVMTFQRKPTREPVEPTTVTSDERQKLLSETEITGFIAAYKVSGNIDKALAAIGRGSSAYRDAARRIVKVYGLKEEA